VAGFGARGFRTLVAAGCGLVVAAGVLVAVERPSFLGFSPGGPYGSSTGTGIVQGRAP
jgi:hypothetical protein